MKQAKYVFNAHNNEQNQVQDHNMHQQQQNKMQKIDNTNGIWHYLVIGPGDSVTALIDDRIWLWNEPSHDGDFFMPTGSATVIGAAHNFSSSNLIMTWLGFVGTFGNSLVHAKSRSNDDWSVTILSGFTVISSHTYLNDGKHEH